jgi:hypothetical protein
MKIFTPPDYPQLNGPSLFLGGSIEMGKADNWQAHLIGLFEKSKNYGTWTFLNPRRKDWDSTWKQDISNPSFYQQVDWELTYLERATARVFYFAADTISPITLMELGKFGNLPNTYIICNTNYQRKGNVDVFCHRYQIPQLWGPSQLVEILHTKV